MAKTLAELIGHVRLHHADADSNLIERAWERARVAHEGVLRRSGEPYFIHPVEVAFCLAQRAFTPEIVVSGLLHDVVEDTAITKNDIATDFGTDIARIVDGVTKLSDLVSTGVDLHRGKAAYTDRKQIQQIENLRSLLISSAGDLRVIVVKIADRLHNMQTMAVMPDHKRKQKSEETIHVYAPLADRLGLREWRDELQDLAFKYRATKKYVSISKYCDTMMHSEVVETAKQDVSDVLNIPEINPISVAGRLKKPFSIWRKMTQRAVGVEEIIDKYAVRVVVPDTTSPYRVLEILHSNFRSNQKAFRDYISNPKRNGYQALHTGIYTKKAEQVEIQIRTETMHEMAEFGIAAHWKYKVSNPNNPILDRGYENELREIADFMEGWRNPSNMLVELSSSISYEKSVFVFSEKGDVYDLPVNSTPIDFAYDVHTDVGHHCVGALVNGVQKPLLYRLQNGDKVRIITDLESKPDPSWLSMVTTGKARAAIRKHLRLLQRDDLIRNGKSILHQHARSLDRDLDDTDFDIARIALGYDRRDDLFVAFGEKRILPAEFFQTLSGASSDEKAGPAETASRVRSNGSAGQSGASRLSNNAYSTSASAIPVIINGVEPLGVLSCSLAECCFPLPGDEIVAIEISEDNFQVHRTECQVYGNLQLSPEQYKAADWCAQDANSRHFTKLHITIDNRPKSLAAVLLIIAAAQVNVNDLLFTHRSRDQYLIEIVLELKNTEVLERVQSDLRALEQVRSLSRTI